jgi:UPF0176 protein
VRPADLKRWLDQGHDDEGRPVVMLDTRNAFEVAVGTFDNAVEYNIDKFSDFRRPWPRTATLEGKTVVSFCTGGIRCERPRSTCRKSASSAFTSSSGILKYFEEVGGSHYAATASCSTTEPR